VFVVATEAVVVVATEAVVVVATEAAVGVAAAMRDGAGDEMRAGEPIADVPANRGSDVCEEPTLNYINYNISPHRRIYSII
jgi:hypothetical protein